MLWQENPTESETENIIVEDGTLTKKEVWDYEIYDPSLLPPSLTKPDEKKIKEFLETYDGVSNVSGLDIFRKTELNLRVKNT